MSAAVAHVPGPSAVLFHDDADRDECGCGCGRPALIGVETLAAQLSMVKRFCERLEVVAAAPNEQSRKADELLWCGQRMIWGLDRAVHADSNPPVLLDPPLPSWLASWRREAVRVLRVKGAERRGWLSRFRRKGQRR